jgi:hypothetical protein
MKKEFIPLYYFVEVDIAWIICMDDKDLLNKNHRLFHARGAICEQKDES